jgi:hypothetical protein
MLPPHALAALQLAPPPPSSLPQPVSAMPKPKNKRLTLNVRKVKPSANWCLEPELRKAARDLPSRSQRQDFFSSSTDAEARPIQTYLRGRLGAFA